jgi:uncharacterized protein YceK
MLVSSFRITLTLSLAIVFLSGCASTKVVSTSGSPDYVHKLNSAKVVWFKLGTSQ